MTAKQALAMHAIQIAFIREGLKSSIDASEYQSQRRLMSNVYAITLKHGWMVDGSFNGGAHGLRAYRREDIFKD